VAGRMRANEPDAEEWREEPPALLLRIPYKGQLAEHALRETDGSRHDKPSIRLAAREQNEQHSG